MIRWVFKNVILSATPPILGCLLLLNSNTEVSSEDINHEFLKEYRNYCTEDQGKLDRFSIEILVRTGQFQVLDIKKIPAAFVFDKSRWQEFSHLESRQWLFSIECAIVPLGKFMSFDLLDDEFKQPLARVDLSGITIW